MCSKNLLSNTSTSGDVIRWRERNHCPYENKNQGRAEADPSTCYKAKRARRSGPEHALTLIIAKLFLRYLRARSVFAGRSLMSSFWRFFLYTRV